MKEIEDELEQIKRLYHDGLLKESDYIKKLKEIVKRKEEKLKESVDNQESANLDFAIQNFTVSDLLILLNS